MLDKYHWCRWAFLGAVILLAACSGSSLESDDGGSNSAVLVNAGANRSVSEGANVSLTGEASGQTDALTYSWSVVPSLTLTQASDTEPTVTFTAPQTTEPLIYTFTLVATDGNGNQASDSVDITVEPINELPRALITVLDPIVVAEQRYPAGVEITLSGAESVDIDTPEGLDPIARYSWQQVDGTSVLDGVSLNGQSIKFTSPILQDASRLTFELTVEDQEGGTDSATINIDVYSQSDTVPTVNAGMDHQVYPGEQILLLGDASTSIPAARPLTYQWLNDSALLPTISNAQTLTTFAVAPMVDTQQVVSFTLEVTDTFGNVVSDDVAIVIKPLPLTRLNDSGVIQQASNTQVGEAFRPSFPGQDGQRGQDIIAENDQLEKAGRGANGFDFTRLDDIGDEVDDTSQPWRCVRDNVTGLIWEVKTTDNGLHDSRHRYSWYQTTANGGFSGDQNGAGASCSIANCNTQAMIAAVNAQGLCNFYDWRLPTHNELLSIVHFGVESGAKVDDEYFPNTSTGLTPPFWYWTRIPSADGVADEDAQNSWAIDFATGNDNFLNKSTPVKIRLVRGGR